MQIWKSFQNNQISMPRNTDMNLYGSNVYNDRNLQYWNFKITEYIDMHIDLNNILKDDVNTHLLTSEDVHA